MHVNDDVPDPRDAEIEALRTRVDHLEEENSRLLEARNPLRESEEKYRRLFEMESDAVFLIDNETGKIIDANPAAAVLYGYSRDEILNMKNTDFSAEPGKTRSATISGEKYIPVRYHRKKNGDVFPVEIAASHLVYRDRQVHIAAIRDITGRKGAEDLLRASEDRYRKFVEEDLTGDFIARPDGAILFCNSSFARIFGFSSCEEALRGNMKSLHPDFHEWERFLADLNSRKRIEYHESIRQKIDGTPISIVENVFGVFDGTGDLVEYKGYIYDDSARKKAEDSFQKSELLYRMLFEKAGEGIVFVEAEGEVAGQIAEINSAAAAMHKGFAKNAIGRHFSHFISPAALEKANALFRRAMDGEWFGGESVHLYSDGNEFPVEYSAGLIDRGDRKYLLVFMRDISERKSAEKKKDELILELQNALAEIKTLRGFIPICSHCKKIRNDSGFWEQIESYLRDHADMVFSHGVCPECMEKYYSKYLDGTDTRSRG